MPLAVLTAALLLGGACSHLPGMGQSAKATPSASASPAGTPLAKATAQLDAEVPMPSDFPADVPLYPKARLTSGASFASSGQVAWGMEWETLDAAAAVDTYFLKQLNQRDWTLTVTKQTPGAFAGTFSRKSNSHASGTLAINADAGVTTIALSFVSSS